MSDQVSPRNPDLFHHIAAQCICGNLREASRAITQMYDEALQPSGLLATQFRLLGAIGAQGPIALTPLADALVMDPTTLARNLKPLERDGLVKISRGADRRTRILQITPQGLAALQKAVPLWEEAQTQIISQIGEEKWRAMLGDWSALVTLVRQ